MPARFDGPPERGIGTIDAVPRHPGTGHTGGEGPFQHLAPELRLGRKGHRLRNARRTPPRRIMRPALRQVEGAIDQGVTMPAGIAEKHADLAVLDAPGRAGILTLHAN